MGESRKFFCWPQFKSYDILNKIYPYPLSSHQLISVVKAITHYPQRENYKDIQVIK